MEVNRLASLKRDADVFVTFEGDNTVLLQVIIMSKFLLVGHLCLISPTQQVAKDLLSQYAKQFGGSKFRAVLHTMIETIKTKIIQG
jgi:hypothetical protein